MEGLSAGTRQFLFRRKLCTSRLSRRALNRSTSLYPLTVTRQYAFSPSYRRKASHEYDSVALREFLDKEREAEEGAEPTQAQPLSGYYSLLLSSRSPYHQATSSRPSDQTPNPTPVEQTPQEKMSIVFGSRLASPGRSSRYNPTTTPESTWKTVNGVPIPPRPDEPDNCCMSGCAHCVWDDFRDEMEEWAGRVEKARAKAVNKDTTSTMQAPRAEVASASTSMDDDGGGSEANWPAPEGDGEDLFANIPVGIREFMKTEKKLKQKHREEGA